MEHLVDRFRDGLVTLVQREHTVILEIVIQCPTDVDEIDLVITIFVNKGRDDAFLSVIDDRRVVSDCVYVIEVGCCLVPVSVDREIQQGVSLPGSVFAERGLDGVVRAVVVLPVTLRAVRNNRISVCFSDTVWKELLELVAVLSGATIDDSRRRHPLGDAVAVVSSITIAERVGGINALGRDILLIAVLAVETENIFDGPEVAGFVAVGGGFFKIFL